jgi:hypothetical protein
MCRSRAHRTSKRSSEEIKNNKRRLKDFESKQEGATSDEPEIHSETQESKPFYLLPLQLSSTPEYHPLAYYHHDIINIQRRPIVPASKR